MENGRSSSFDGGLYGQQIARSGQMCTAFHSGVADIDKASLRRQRTRSQPVGDMFASGSTQALAHPASHFARPLTKFKERRYLMKAFTSAS